MRTRPGRAIPDAAKAMCITSDQRAVVKRAIGDGPSAHNDANINVQSPLVKQIELSVS